MRTTPIDILFLRALLGMSVIALCIIGAAMAFTPKVAPPRVVFPPPDFKLTVSSDGHEMSFSGVVDHGLTAAMRDMVAQHPDLRRMVLESSGGYVAEARGAVTVLRAHGINTHVAGHCASACALIFVGGRARSLSPGARLGLHGYHIDPTRNSIAMIDPRAEMQRDMAIFRAQSVDEGFVARLESLPRTPMWYPSHAELQAVGMIGPAPGHSPR